MNNYLIITVLFYTLINTQTSTTIAVSLHNNQNDNLNPLNDPDQDTSQNEQDKRTICSVFNSLSCSGSKQQTIYYKTRPAASYAVSGKPIGVYRYTNPKIPFAIKAPASVRPTYGNKWRPVMVKPSVVVPVARPVETAHGVPTTTPAHFVQTVPIIGQSSHVHPWNHVHLAQGQQFGAVAPFNQLIPLKTPSAVVPIAKPVYPAAPVIFEVTKPNLGVLPLGAKFNTHVLNEISQHYNLKPTVSVVQPAPPLAVPIPSRPIAVQPNVFPTPGILPAAPQAVQGIIQTPVGFPQIVPQPGVSVEYHGKQNFFHNPAGHLHADYNAAHPHLHLPYQHDAHGYDFQPQQQPFVHDHYHQHLEQQQQYLAQQQQQQQDSSAAANYQVLPQQSYQHEIPEGRLPLEGEQQFATNQQGYTSDLSFFNAQNDYEQNNGVIQPGQTDVPFPYHLPNHPTWQPSLGAYETQEAVQDTTNINDPSVFRPSPELEPPYVKK